jgi:competence protein ComEA
MFKQIILALGALVAATAFAAVDINKASQAELEPVKGHRPVALDEDHERATEGAVQGLERPDHAGQGRGRRGASKFSQNGLTVNGAPFTGPTAAGAAKATKAEGIKKKVDAAPAAKK